MTLEPCVICKHPRDHHAVSLGNEKFCGVCLIEAARNSTINTKSFQHEFKLDNLQFVEDLAKEKGLL